MYKQGKPGNILYSAVGGGGGSFYNGHNILTPPPTTTTTVSFTNHKVLCIKGMEIE